MVRGPGLPRSVARVSTDKLERTPWGFARMLFWEDDVRPEGYERAEQAWPRITGEAWPTEWFAKVDDFDVTYRRWGTWVLIGTCEGAGIGRLV